MTVTSCSKRDLADVILRWEIILGYSEGPSVTPRASMRGTQEELQLKGNDVMIDTGRKGSAKGHRWPLGPGKVREETFC